MSLSLIQNVFDINCRFNGVFLASQALQLQFFMAAKMQVKP